MTKLLKGQSARTTSDVSEFISARQIASMQARTASASDAAPFSALLGRRPQPRPSTASGAKGMSAAFGLPCLTGKELLANFLNRGGDRVARATARS